MGVRGLKSFLERKNQTRPINVDVEVNEWKKDNPNQKPIIVIDFDGLANAVGRRDDADNLCGGRHQFVTEKCTRLLNALKATGCTLVFFADLNIQKGKSNEWLNRRNDEFQTYVELYNLISDGRSFEEILNKNNTWYALSSTFQTFAEIAHSYGEFYYSVRHECDLEIAQYATRHKAMAVITNDTDFLIFEGNWKFWCSKSIQITSSNQLKTVEYDRNALANLFSLSSNQLPMFATLMGNDFTNIYYKQLTDFYKAMGSLNVGFRTENTATFVRNEFWRHTDDNIKKIVRKVFGQANDDKIQLVKDSLDSYNINFPPAIISDPIETKLIHTNIYRTYMGNMGHLHGLNLIYYDMRGCTADANISSLYLDWLKRRKGVLGIKGTFTLLMKRNINEQYMVHTETVTCPDFSIPPLDQLYLDSNVSEDIRWRIFAWIMSINEDILCIIRKLPKEFLLISTTLFALVKNNLISIEAADGILYTEFMVCEKQIPNIQYPVVLVAGFVRAAHVYNMSYTVVQQNFAIAGLQSFIQRAMRFDGVYFQKLIKKLDEMNATDRESFLGPIQKYRIYAANA